MLLSTPYFISMFDFSQPRARLDAMDRKNNTPLMTAASRINDKIFSKMLDEGSDGVEATLLQVAKETDENLMRALKVGINYANVRIV